MSTESDADPLFETRVPLVSRGLTLFAATTSLPVLALIAYLTAIENDPWWVVALAAAFLFGPLLALARLRLHVELFSDELRYRVRPWHRRTRVVSFDDGTQVERLSHRPKSRMTLRRVNLGRDWIDWNAEEVRYVLSGDSGVRFVREGKKDVLLWFSEGEGLTAALGETDALR